MKEVMGAARNLYMAADEKGKLMPMIEAVVIVSEPTFKIVSANFEKVSRESTIRFHAHPDVIRALAVQFANWANEADELAKKTTTYPHDVQGMATEGGDGGGVQQPRQ